MITACAVLVSYRSRAYPWAISRSAMRVLKHRPAQPWWKQQLQRHASEVLFSRFRCPEGVTIFSTAYPNCCFPDAGAPHGKSRGPVYLRRVCKCSCPAAWRRDLYVTCRSFLVPKSITDFVDAGGVGMFTMGLAGAPQYQFTLRPNRGHRGGCPLLQCGLLPLPNSYCIAYDAGYTKYVYLCSFV